ncbi:heme exporter protein CcmB [Solemya velum gill symbiont]|uniref:Heme exporter protein B n=3 Tax=Solemya velum gill symbiont TaxID=2340 RepID=A0A0B0H975_SOVGS|nr:heme exporter protein CcmB [Solemya velum gill symbiont]KHF25655.1 ABC-type heme exporter protein CcmABCD, subunit B [Solemya velum gill symbiont]OOY35741.1 heme exporter protein CcmB [Solemya velum gill symbiont]OOY38369.1 heme exporter protein CcmB [Solemya velum gill symbiont]OOY40967.1 heme exporter protein CcmB [Solemya velum gill symbiont]OOY43497.1 heme exporter protein CcmB [Solemya velum gill symbiont]
MSVWSAFIQLIRRDLVLALRRRSELANPILFFVMVIVLFPLGIGAEPNLLARMAPGIVWVSALLAALLSMDAIFRSDFEDGTLEQLLLSAQPLPVLILAKVSAHWLVTGLPLLIVAPLLAVFLGMSETALGALLISLALGTPVLSLIGTIGVALTVGLRRGGVILSLLVLPLYVPVLIFGASMVDSAATGLSFSGQIYILAAFLALALSLAPVAAASALRISLS